MSQPLPQFFRSETRTVEGRPLRRPFHAKAKPKSTSSKSSRPIARQKSFAPRLVMMVKDPKIGQVKTRLAQGVGGVRAASFYRNASSALFSRLSDTGRWETYIAVSPDNAVAKSVWPLTAHRFAQGRGDLGQRMNRVMEGLPPGPVVIVGTDSPALTPAHVKEAFARLGQNDAVVGPASDGGYWLVGLKRRPHVPKAFQSVRWSSADTLADTLANLKTQSVATLATLDDVDEATDLERVKSFEGRRILPAS